MWADFPPPLPSAEAGSEAPLSKLAAVSQHHAHIAPPSHWQHHTHIAPPSPPQHHEHLARPAHLSRLFARRQLVPRRARRLLPSQAIGAPAKNRRWRGVRTPVTASCREGASWRGGKAAMLLKRKGVGEEGTFDKSTGFGDRASLRAAQLCCWMRAFISGDKACAFS